MDAVRTRPQPTKSTRVPSLQKSYYSDSGTGSYSGVEVPLLESPESHSLTPDILQGSRGSALEQSLAKSLSVAIPIPLFTSEQYRVKEFRKECPDSTQEQYHHMNGGHGTPSHRFPRPVYRVTSTASAQDPSGSPFLVIHGRSSQLASLPINLPPSRFTGKISGVYKCNLVPESILEMIYLYKSTTVCIDGYLETSYRLSWCFKHQRCEVQFCVKILFDV